MGEDQNGSGFRWPGRIRPQTSWSELDIEHGGADLKMSHEMLEPGRRCRRAPYRRRSMPESMRIGLRNWLVDADDGRNRERSPAAVMGLSTMAAFEADEQRKASECAAVPAADKSAGRVIWLGSGGSLLVSLTRTRICVEASWRSRADGETSQDRRPSSNIKPATARSRKVRKLRQKVATSSAESGAMIRCGASGADPRRGRGKAGHNTSGDRLV